MQQGGARGQNLGASAGGIRAYLVAFTGPFYLIILGFVALHKMFLIWRRKYLTILSLCPSFLW